MYEELLTIDELETRTRRLAQDPRVSVTQVGVSRLGRPIEMISLGEGDENALIVGVPHPNEPAGAVTVERLISLLLENPSQRRGYRWHFIKAIDPEGLRLNEGWLKTRTVRSYLQNFFRPALHRQPETTFPLDIPEARFTDSMPENEAWQRALALTRPRLHASLHHCDYGGVFYSLSRALPTVLEPLEAIAARAGVGVNDLEGDVMDAEQWTPAVKRYPSVPELIAKAKASGAAWAYPWTVGEMSPGYGESQFGTFTLIAEIPLWDCPRLHDRTPCGMTYRQQQNLLHAVATKARGIAVRQVPILAAVTATPDTSECLWALERGLAMMPTPKAPDTAVSAQDERILSFHDFELLHTEHVLFVLRTYALLIRLTELILLDMPGNAAVLAARLETREALAEELAVIETHSHLKPVPLQVVTDFQMQAIFACADALAATH